MTSTGVTTSAVPPISSAPNELLSAIFECFVVDWEQRKDSKWGELLRFLRAISLVSRTWHDVALHTPVLWRNVYCRPGSIFASQCIQRSGAIPMTIWGRDLECTVAILRDLVFSNADVRIEHLHLDLAGVSHNYDSKPAAFRYFPIIRPKRLSLYNLVITPYGFVAFLKRFPELESLQLIVVAVQSIHTTPVEPALMARLRSMDIHTMLVGGAISLLRLIAAPALTDFYIRTFKADDITDMPFDTPATFRSLRKLTIHTWMKASLFRGLLRWFPEVETLEVTIRYTNDFAFDVLIADRPADEIVACNLQTLKLMPSLHDWSIILDVLGSRLRSPLTAPIKVIALKNGSSSRMDPNDMEKLEKAVRIAWWEPPNPTWDFKGL